MLFPILSAILICLLGWLFLKFHQRNQYWAKKGVPYAAPHPLLGNLTFLFKENVGAWYRSVHEKFSSPFVGIWVFWKPALIISDPQVARRILIKDNEVFRNRHLGSGKTDPIGSMNIFTLNDPLWSNVRRRLTYIFTAAKLKTLHGLTSSKTKELVQRINNDKAENKVIELRSLFADFSTDIIGTFAFGIENNATLTSDSPMRSVTRDFMQFNLLRGISWVSIFFWPALVDIFRFSLFPRKTVKFFRATINTIIKQRSASKIEKNDLLDALVKMKKEGLDEGQEFSDDLLVSQAVVMLQGGFDTSSGSLTFITYELAHNSDIQNKLYEELIDAKEKNNDAEFDFNTLENLPYLNSVIKEGLRRYPALGWLDRIASVDYNITDSLTIEKDTPVYINAIGMHHDPKYFPEPYTFKPDRFLPENEKDIIPGSYLPFGDGPRVCIGQRFALMTLRYCLAELILRLQIRPVPGYPKPTEVQLEKNGLFLMPGQPLTVNFIPRDC